VNLVFYLVNFVVKKNKKMNQLKKLMGIAWMLLAPIIIFFLVSGAVQNIGHGTKDINKPIPWIIIITIFTPIAIGLMIFGYYSFKGEYDSTAKDI
jgi:Na+/serine symporter